MTLAKGAARRAAKELEAALAALGDPTRAAKEKAYLKSDRRHFGVPVPVVRRTAKAFARERPGSRSEKR